MCCYARQDKFWIESAPKGERIHGGSGHGTVRHASAVEGHQWTRVCRVAGQAPSSPAWVPAAGRSAGLSPQKLTMQQCSVPAGLSRQSHTDVPLTGRLVPGRVRLTAVFPVPEYLAETAAREPAVREWLAGLPQLVAGLASRWALSVGEPFQPGGQCSWTAPATNAAGTALVLKVGSGLRAGKSATRRPGCGHGQGTGPSACMPPATANAATGSCWSGACPAPRWDSCGPSPTRTSWCPGSCAG